eukprot:scaffold1007_cov176-Amphora_coffeaeformis.AAC.38
MTSVSVAKAEHTSKVLKHKRRYCRVAGCQRIVKSQGLCQGHGAKPRTCKIDGCTKQAQGNFHGMCKSHAREFHVKKGKQTTVAACAGRSVEQQPSCTVVSSPPTITIHHDEKPVYSHEENNDRDPTRATASMPTAPSTPSPLKHKNRRLCRHKGCTSVIKSQGLCQRHGAIPARCKITGCPKQTQGSFQGMCKAHHQVYMEAKARTASALSCHAYHPPPLPSTTSRRIHNNNCVSEDEEMTTIKRRPSTSSNSSSNSRSTCDERHFCPTWERPYYCCQSSNSTRREELAADLFTPSYEMAMAPIVGGEKLLLPPCWDRSSSSSSYRTTKASRASWNDGNPVTPMTVPSTSEFEALDFSDIDHLDLSDIDHFFDFDENELEQPFTTPTANPGRFASY